jgi:hypothetical protein
MDSGAFHKLRRAVQDNCAPGSEADLASVLDHVEAILRTSRYFDEVEVGPTEDPDQMVVALCRCSDGVLPWEAANGLERLWRKEFGDAPWESHSVVSSETLLDFEGALTTADGAHYVTVHVVAAGEAQLAAAAAD